VFPSDGQKRDGDQSVIGIKDNEVLAIPKPLQFAEKVHAYSFPWQGRLNTRTKDLVDLVMLIERGPLVPAEIRTALAATFDTRSTHPIPDPLVPLPTAWKKDCPEMAAEAGLSTGDYLEAFEVLERFWTTHALGSGASS
jgi:hypothetical protein